MTNNKLTDGQLTKIILSAGELVSALAGTNEDISQNDTAEICRMYDYLNDNDAPPEVVLAMAIELQERRKAAAEPMAYTTEFYLQELNKSGLYQCWLSRDARNAEYNVPLFAAFQSVMLPPEMPAHTGPRQDGRPQAYTDGWNACRDAMQSELQERRKTDKVEPVSFDALNAAVAEVTGSNQHAWDAAIYKGHQAVPFMNYNSLARIVDKYRVPQSAPERNRIRREHAEWADITFGNIGPVGPLKHLSQEALEAAAAPGDLSEWADMQFLLWDAQRRAGISDEQITQAMIEKLEVNKQREWPEPKDGEPRLHIKSQDVNWSAE